MAKVSTIANVDVTFTNLRYTVQISRKKEKKEILKSISGKFKCGELTAIMGPSGAGKSSLLNILTGFTKYGIQGTIDYGNGLKKRKVCSYILQDDHFFPWFTVEESMLLAATLKIANKSMSLKEKQLLIENILDTLHLTACKQTKCSNLSGGQKKRLSIALELIDNPPVLYFDEPTTGLDSSASWDTVKLLHSLCKDGRTIVCTIHQPSSTIYHIFEHIYVLNAGYCVYQGTPKNTIPFLNSIGLQVPQYHNPADYLLEVTTGEYGDFRKEMIDLARDTRWRFDTGDDNNSESSLMPPLYNDILESDRQQNGKSNSNGNNDWIQYSAPTVKHIYPPPEWVQLWVLIGRCHIQFFRDWTVTHLKLALHIFCAILIGLLFGDSGANASKVIANIGLFLVAIVYLWYTTMMPGVLRFPSEIATIKKETFNHWYRLRTYYLATVITSTPVHIIFSTVFTTIIYLMTDQPFELDRFVKFALITITVTITADGFGILLGTLVDPVNGTFFGAIFTCFMLLFAGFLILFEHMPSILYGVSFISPHRYGLESLVLSVYNNDRSDMICPETEIYCHLRKPSSILKALGMAEGDYGFNVVMILLQAIFLKSLSYFTLRRALMSDGK